MQSQLESGADDIIAAFKQQQSRKEKQKKKLSLTRRVMATGCSLSKMLAQVPIAPEESRDKVAALNCQPSSPKKETRKKTKGRCGANSSLIGTRLATAAFFYLPDRPLSLSAHQGVAYANGGNR